MYGKHRQPYYKPMAKLDDYVKGFFGLLAARWVAKILLPVLGVILLVVLLVKAIS
jgi:hypothetical protein